MIDDNVVNQLRQEIDKISSTLVIVAPFLNSLLRKARIIATDSIPTAATDISHQILINPEFFLKLPFEDQTWTIEHEVVHMAFDHVNRGKNKNMFVWNLCTDAVVNSLLSEMIRCSSKFWDTLIGYHQLNQLLTNMGVKIPNDFTKLSAEELYDLFPKKQRGGRGRGEIRCPRCHSKNVVVDTLDYDNMTATFRCNSCGYKWVTKIYPYSGNGIGSEIPVEKVKGKIPSVNRDLMDKKYEGRVVQSGDNEIYKEKDEKERAYKWKEEIFKAYTVQKQIGTIPAGLKRIIDKLFKPSVNWRSLLRVAVKEGIGKTVVENWQRPSRKHSSLPGLKRFTIPTVWTLVDTSGSISENELTQFISDIYAVAKNNCEIKNICWDADAYEIVTARNKNEVITKINNKMRGGGGTQIRFALSKTLKRMKPRDIVIVFTDGDIYDIDWDETKKLLSDIAYKASVSVFATTRTEWDIEGWRLIKVKVNKH